MSIGTRTMANKNTESGSAAGPSMAFIGVLYGRNHKSMLRDLDCRSIRYRRRPYDLID